LLQIPKIEEAKKIGRVWIDWLKEPQFYIFALVYTFSRMALNSTAIMLPFFLTTCTGFEKPPGEGISP
jgi:hypothetical protein